jgi:hypothetical protein
MWTLDPIVGMLYLIGKGYHQESGCGQEIKLMICACIVFYSILQCLDSAQLLELCDHSINIVDLASPLSNRWFYD